MNVRSSVLEALCAEHGHLGREDGLRCRSCVQHTNDVMRLLRRQPAVTEAGLIEVLCTTHVPYMFNKGVGCRTCARRAERVLAVTA